MAIARVDGQGVSGTLHWKAEHDVTINGPAVAASWDAVGNVLEVHTDHFGLVPLFYWTGPQCALVSDSLAELAAAIPSPRLDPQSASVFLRLGFYIGNDSPVLGVKVFSPASQARVSPGAIALTTRSAGLEYFSGDLNAAIEAYADRFANSIAIRATHGVGRLTLSGGRDSRHILLELLKQGFRPSEIVTQDRPINTDLETASLLARRVGITHIRLQPYRDSMDDELTKNRFSHFLADENAWYMQIAAHLQGTVFDGLGAGVLSGSDQFPVDLISRAMRRSAREGAEALLDAMGSEPRYLKRQFQRLWNRDLALEALGIEVLKHVDTPNPLKSFLFWNRTRREISLIPIAIAARHAPVCLPYMDPDLASFLLSLPFEAFQGYKLHDAVIKQKYPEFADIPFGSKRRAPPDRSRALQTIKAMLEHTPAGLMRPRSELLSVAQAVSSGQNRSLSWFFRVLPVLQAMKELNLSETALEPLAPSSLLR